MDSHPRKVVWMRVKNAALVKELLAARGMSQRNLATAVGCSRGMISQLLYDPNKTCSPRLAALIAHALDCGIDNIFLLKVSTVGVDASAAAEGRKARVA